MARAPDSSEPDAAKPGPSGKGIRRVVIWVLGGLFVGLVAVLTALPVIKAEENSMAFQWVIFGLLSAVLIAALVLLPLVTRKR